MVAGSLIATPLIGAQQKEGQKLKMVQFQMALLKKGPQWDRTTQQQRGKILQQHFANVLSMLETGSAVIAGPLGDDTTLACIFIRRASTNCEAKTWVDAQP